MDKINAQLVHMDTRQRMADNHLSDQVGKGLISGKQARNVVVQQQAFVAQFKNDVYETVLAGKSRSEAVNEIINKYKKDDIMNVLPKTEPKAVKKKVKSDSFAIKALLKMGEDLAEGNKQAKKEHAEEEELNHRVQQRTNAYLKDFYEELNKN